jgi:hypothetical protein
MNFRTFFKEEYAAVIYETSIKIVNFFLFFSKYVNISFFYDKGIKIINFFLFFSKYNYISYLLLFVLLKFLNLSFDICINFLFLIICFCTKTVPVNLIKIIIYFFKKFTCQFEKNYINLSLEISHKIMNNIFFYIYNFFYKFFKVFKSIVFFFHSYSNEKIKTNQIMKYLN